MGYRANTRLSDGSTGGRDKKQSQQTGKFKLSTLPGKLSGQGGAGAIRFDLGDSRAKTAGDANSFTRATKASGIEGGAVKSVAIAAGFAGIDAAGFGGALPGLPASGTASLAPGPVTDLDSGAGVGGAGNAEAAGIMAEFLPKIEEAKKRGDRAGAIILQQIMKQRLREARERGKASGGRQGGKGSGGRSTRPTTPPKPTGPQLG